MNKRAFIVLIIFLNLSLGMEPVLYAYDNKVVHQIINNKAVLLSDLNNILKNKIGYSSGLETKFNAKEVWQWFEEGGKQEDEPICRSRYHFHDPTKTFDTAGLSNVAINTACLNYDNESSIMWSQNQGNLWSWQKGRDYYYQALTAVDKNIREHKFSDTFRAVGQVMHLLSDASVPEHTRNDIHIFPWFDNPTQSSPQIGSWTYETWCKWNASNLNTNVTAQDYGITNTSIVSGLLPIFNFWDTTPSPITGSFIPVGLAEYSNYNFLSRDTMFRDYVYPEKPNHFVGVVVAEDGVTDNRIYFQGTTSDNKVINHLASTGYLWSELTQISANTMNDSRFNLDDTCYKDYAEILVPKAVSYSTALLNYFFRGSIEITLPNSGIYSSATPTNTGFTTIKVQAKNTTANSEKMLDGSIELVVKYRLALEDPFKNYAEDYDFQVEPDFSYIVAPEKNGVRTISRTGPVELTFDLPAEIPLWAIDVYLQVVYHGKLGNEDGAVAVGFKDISEPTPIDMSSDTDKICISGSLYTAGSQTAIDLIDKGPNGNNNGKADEWDVYQHSQKDIYIKIAQQNTQEYASPTDYTFYIPALAAGGFSRDFYILTEEHFNYSIVETWVNDYDGDPWIYLPSQARLYTGTAIKNQTDYVEDAAECAPWTAPCDIWWYPTFLSYRDRDEWWGTGNMYFNNAYPQGSECTCYQGILNTCMQ